MSSLALSINVLVSCVESLVSIKVDPFLRTAFRIGCPWSSVNIVGRFPYELVKHHERNDENKNAPVNEETEQEKRIFPPEKVIMAVGINEKTLNQ